MTTPKVFVSYSHDSSEHKEWVLKLCSDLMAKGVEVTLESLTNERVDASPRRAEIHAGLYELFLERKTAREH